MYVWQFDNCKKQLMTAWQLPDNCLTTFWQLTDNCLKLAYNWLTTFWRLPDNCLKLADNCLTSGWQLPYNCQQRTDNFLKTAWWLADNYLTTARQLQMFDNWLTTIGCPKVARYYYQWKAQEWVTTVTKKTQLFRPAHGLLYIWTELLYLVCPHEAALLTLTMSHKLTQSF